jgi:hypothetical protein
MSKIELNISDKHVWYLDDSNELQGIITEVIYDYVEMKQDQDTRWSLEKNSYFGKLNKSLEKKLWKL